MRLMRETDVPETPRDHVFRASRMHGVLLALAVVGVCAAILFYHWPAPRPSYYFSAGILIVLLLLRRFITARFHPSNWLVRIGDDGLFIHFRSYLNDHLSADDPTVVFIAFQEIHSARLVRERVETPDLSTQRGTTTQFLRWVEFELATDPAPLADALSTELGRPAAEEKRWYGTSATLYRDYPVLMQTQPFLRAKWQVVPRAAVFLSAIKPRVEIAAPIKLASDFTKLQGLSREQQEERLRELDQRGNTIGAVYMARRLYGGDLAEATRFVDNLRSGARS
jgi:hypothetical protein